MKTPRKRDTRIPRRPLLWLAAALIFTLPPMFRGLAFWIPVAFLVALAAKFWLEPRGYRLRSKAAQLVAAGISLIAIFATFGSLRGIDPAISIIALLMSIKILEAHTAREFQIMAMMGFVLCLCGFFLSQDLAIAFSLLIAFVLLLAALIQFHRGAGCAFGFPIRAALKLLLQATPIIILLFLLFPRFSTGFRFQVDQGRDSAAGFSGQLSAGSVSSLAHSSAVAFRVEFPDGKIPPPSALYWRGAVMSQGDGFEWRAPPAPAALHRTNRPREASPGRTAIRQSITLEPHNERWMFALDWPTAAPLGSILAPGYYLSSGRPIRTPCRYDVVSYPDIREKRLYDRERTQLLQVPLSIGPKTRALVESWKSQNADPRAIAHRAIEFFRTQRFRYSLSPGEYKKNDLDEFLFQRRLGFCEHYAAAFATLMRLAGIPARVVTGYLGGEYNEIGNFFLVRQADAHAWCEVWLPESGWTRIDPTSVVAPDRVSLGLDSFLERRATADTQDRHLSFFRQLKRLPTINRAMLAWQTLNYAWDTHVLSFDGDAQEALFTSVGGAFRSPLALFVATAVMMVVMLALFAAWVRTTARLVKNPVKVFYENFCRKAATLGVERNPTEGPLDFSNRACQLLPAQAELIRQIIADYVVLRYSVQQGRHLLDRFAADVRAFIRGEQMRPACRGSASSGNVR
jgi:protein-glutamine gamma-glutamyltransferase